MEWQNLTVLLVVSCQNLVPAVVCRQTGWIETSLISVVEVLRCCLARVRLVMVRRAVAELPVSLALAADLVAVDLELELAVVVVVA